MPHWWRECARPRGRRVGGDGIPDILKPPVGAPIAVFNAVDGQITCALVVNSIGDAADANVGNSICETATPGECTLRAAIEEANFDAATDTIAFNIPGGSHKISPNSALPAVSEAAVIDGTSEPDYTGTPLVEIDGTSAGTHGLHLTAGGSTVTGLVINNFSQNGILIESDDNIIQGNYIGTNAAGTAAQANGDSGIAIDDGSRNLIGGATTAARNVISGNGKWGVLISGASATENEVQGNRIGTNALGTAAVPNGFSGVLIFAGAFDNLVGGPATTPGTPPGNLISGNDLAGVNIQNATTELNAVEGNLIGTNAAGSGVIPNTLDGVLIIDSPDNDVGGATAAQRNVISGNGQAGVEIRGVTAVDNEVRGNFIGTDVAGALDRGNTLAGVLIDGAPGNFIGGSAATAGTPPGNVISGNNRYGVEIDGIDAAGNEIQGNLIGTDVTGTLDRGNSIFGVNVTGAAPGNIIGGVAGTTPGGPCTGECNVVSGNNFGGVGMTGSGTATQVLGNYIGTDASGMADVGNGERGVIINGSDSNIVGGATAQARNVISGNDSDGVWLTGSSQNNVVLGNYIGTDATGNASLPNSSDGVEVSSTNQNTIGGAAAGAGNVISGNGENGIYITGNGSMDNTVRGNNIGTDVNGTAGVGNTSHGVFISNGASDNTTGGAPVGSGNTIAFNGGAGVRVDSTAGTGNLIDPNSITSNGGLGIDLGLDGPDANDLDDADVGANDLQNFPVLDSAVNTGLITAVTGLLNSVANTTFTIEFFTNSICDPSGFGEGETFAGSTDVTTDGATPFDAVINTTLTGVSIGDILTATATDPGGNTSEFSECREVVDPFDVEAAVAVANAAPGAARQTTTMFDVPHPGNIDWDILINFDPADDVTQTCNAGATHTAGGACLATGDLVGAVALDMFLSTVNSPCDMNSVLDFDLYAVPTPNIPADPRASTNIAYTQPEGTSDRFSRWGTSPIGVGGGTPVIYTGTKAVAANIAFENYPEFLLDLYDADGPGGGGDPLVPLAVYGAISNLLGAQAVPIYIVTFNPGALATAFPTPNPLGQATPNLGFAMQTVLNDPTQTAANPSATLAFCSTSVETTLNAIVGGITRATNPTAGTRLNLTWAASRLDLDNDGVEDALDTCPFDVNIDGDPRVAGSDPDGDMIDSVCDTIANGLLGPAVDDGNDVDSDGWQNLQDNCPLVSNPGQLDSELSLGVAPGYTAGRADDGGPLGDGIGDACDTGSLAVVYNGIAHDGVTDHDPGVGTLIFPEIALSPTVANGRWWAKGLVTPICYGGTDADGDGYCAGLDADDNNPDRTAPWTLPPLSAVLGATSTIGAGSWDTDGGRATGSAGFDSDWLETYVGTDARQACALTSSLIDEPLDAWLFDINGDQKATLSDVLAVSPFLLAAPARRFDWNADGFVTLGDVLSIAPVFNLTCT